MEEDEQWMHAYEAVRRRDPKIYEPDCVFYQGVFSFIETLNYMKNWFKCSSTLPRDFKPKHKIYSQNIIFYCFLACFSAIRALVKIFALYDDQPYM